MTLVRGTRPRVLVVAPELPYPPRSGVPLRCWQQASLLHEVADVGVFGLRPGGAPRPPSSFLLWRSALSPFPESGGPWSAEWIRRDDGHPSAVYASRELVDEVLALVTELAPDVVVLETLWLHGHIGPLKANGCRVVLDMHNVDGPLHREIAGGATGGERLLRTLLAERVESIEEAALSTVDQLWVCSEQDARLVRSCYPQAAPTAVVPNAVDVDAYRMREGWAERRPFEALYPGMFGYPPNEEAALVLLRDVHPRVLERFGGATLVLLGGHTSGAMREAAALTSGVSLTGAIADARPYFERASVMPVPLRAGSGTRFKILEAFASGLPVVSTAKGAHGLDLVDGDHLVLAETPEEFVEAIGTLWSYPERARRMASAARALVEARYSWASVRSDLEQALEACGLEARA